MCSLTEIVLHLQYRVSLRSGNRPRRGRRSSGVDKQAAHTGPTSAPNDSETETKMGLEQNGTRCP